MRFRWTFKLPDGSVQHVANTIPDVGEEAFLKMLMRDDQTIVAGGANFYVGLCDQAPQETDILSDITTEPTTTNGYARQPVIRSVVGWPTIQKVNGTTGLRSLALSFTASGGAFSGPFSRAFLCNVVSGTSGILFAYSGALSSPITLQDTQSFPMQFEFFLN